MFRIPLGQSSSISTHAPARGATKFCIDSVPVWHISTHAPARGATYFSTIFLEAPRISTHAPARGATCATGKLRYGRPYFNPRSREGSDLLYEPPMCRIKNFNPRSREGSDSRSFWHPQPSDQFQPTLPRGERPLILSPP